MKDEADYGSRHLYIIYSATYRSNKGTDNEWKGEMLG